MRPEGSRGRSAKVSVPLGTPDNSPAFQRWVGLREGEFRPVGTVEITGKRPTDYFSRAYGTRSTLRLTPPLKWRAIFRGPSGTIALADC